MKEKSDFMSQLNKLLLKWRVRQSRHVDKARIKWDCFARGVAIGTAACRKEIALLIERQEGR